MLMLQVARYRGQRKFSQRAPLLEPILLSSFQPAARVESLYQKQE